ncbi:MAG: quinolinate synthase NadA [Lachnospiraceae bacterium]|nr:quinolinate synthase NadA [Lachnospiraceae bacterium]
MTTKELQDLIMEEKKKRNVCILAHAYLSHDIWEVADYVGDSYGLSLQAAKAPQETVVMGGVRFMAETVKLLSPEKKVLLANPLAGCPMADQITREKVLELKKQYPNHCVVAYINTTTDLKRAVDVVVTSSSAVTIMKNLPDKNILFIPDCNLGDWVQKQCPEKNFSFIHGGCPTHMKIHASTVEKAKALHPDALFAVHPECIKEVVALADYVGSTTGIMKFCKESDAKEFIIGTEQSIVQHLQMECPDKFFYPVSTDLVCHNMKMTTLVDVYHSVVGMGGEEIFLSDETIREARTCIDRMIELGG